MATYNLLFSVKVRGLQLFAGDLIDDGVDNTTEIQAAGGVLIATGNAVLDAAALKCRQSRLYKAINESECDTIMGGAFDKSSAGALNQASGTGTLASGTLAVSYPGMTANTKVTITMRDPGAGALTTFIAFDVPVASRSAGVGFTVNAIDNAKATLATAACTFDWIATG